MKQKFRIAYLCSSLGWGGLEMNHLRNALWMDERGHDVSIICTRHSPLHLAAKKTHLRIIDIRKPSKHYAFLSAYRLKRKLMRLKVAHLLIRNSFDVSLAASISFFSGRQIKSHFFMEMMFQSNKQQIFRTLRYSFLDSWVCSLQYMKGVVCSSTKMDSDKVHVIPSGLDFRRQQHIPKELARKQLGLPENQVLFGMIGRIDRKKRLDLAISALKICQNTSFQLYFIGESTPDTYDQYRIELENLVEDLTLQNQVHFVGFKENTKDYFRAMDAIIMASDFETFGMSTIESIAQETPVIASNAGGSKELLARFKLGILFSPGRVTELSEAMTNIQNLTFSTFDYQAFKDSFDHEHICKKVETEILSGESER